VLVDTGIGNKESAKFLDIYGVENAGTQGPTQLDDALAEVGFVPAGEAHVAFPGATYVVQRGELDFAGLRNERIAASYLAPNFAPVAAADRWRLVDGETELLPGILLVPTPGHVPHHQSVLLSSQGETACFLGDLVPTTAHLPLPWIMGYDLEPLVTLESKRSLLGRAEAEGWVLVFEHDPIVGLGRVAREGKSYRFAPLDTPQGHG
jgi:glyoxylase-like metal-dependent hydrolase (beta-lactamase superfamily II)